jgi:bacteriophage HK97-gp10 putative tail-component
MALVFKPNRHGIERLLNSPQGAVGADLLRRGLRVEAQAKVNASGRPGPNVDTGRLRSSIRTDLVERDGRVVCRVGAYTEYAVFVELGTDRAPPYPFLQPALSAAR